MLLNLDTTMEEMLLSPLEDSDDDTTTNNNNGTNNNNDQQVALSNPRSAKSEVKEDCSRMELKEFFAEMTDPKEEKKYETTTMDQRDSSLPPPHKEEQQVEEETPIIKTHWNRLFRGGNGLLRLPSQSSSIGTTTTGTAPIQENSREKIKIRRMPPLVPLLTPLSQQREIEIELPPLLPSPTPPLSQQREIPLPFLPLLPPQSQQQRDIQFRFQPQSQSPPKPEAFSPGTTVPPRMMMMMMIKYGEETNRHSLSSSTAFGIRSESELGLRRDPSLPQEPLEQDTPSNAPVVDDTNGPNGDGIRDGNPGDDGCSNHLPSSKWKSNCGSNQGRHPADCSIRSNSSTGNPSTALQSRMQKLLEFVTTKLQQTNPDAFERIQAIAKDSCVEATSASTSVVVMAQFLSQIKQVMTQEQWEEFRFEDDFGDDASDSAWLQLQRQLQDPHGTTATATATVQVGNKERIESFSVSKDHQGPLSGHGKPECCAKPPEATVSSFRNNKKKKKQKPPPTNGQTMRRNSGLCVGKENSLNHTSSTSSPRRKKKKLPIFQTGIIPQNDTLTCRPSPQIKKPHSHSHPRPHPQQVKAAPPVTFANLAKNAIAGAAESPFQASPKSAFSAQASPFQQDHQQQKQQQQQLSSLSSANQKKQISSLTQNPKCQPSSLPKPLRRPPVSRKKKTKTKVDPWYSYIQQKLSDHHVISISNKGTSQLLGEIVSKGVLTYLEDILKKTVYCARQRQNMDGIRLWHQQAVVRRHGRKKVSVLPPPLPPPLLVRLGCNIPKQVHRSEGYAAYTVQCLEEALATSPLPTTARSDSDDGSNQCLDYSTLLEMTSMNAAALRPPVSQNIIDQAALDAYNGWLRQQGDGDESNDKYDYDDDQPPPCPFGRIVLPKKQSKMIQLVDLQRAMELPGSDGRRRRRGSNHNHSLQYPAAMMGPSGIVPSPSK